MKLSDFLTKLELDNADFSDFGTGPSGYVRLSDLTEALTKLLHDNSCASQNGKHDFVEVHSWRGTMPGAEGVVRWCQCCGAVVIDSEVDGRVSPGAIMKLKAPKAATTLHQLLQP